MYDAVPQQKNAGSEGGGQSKGGHGTKRRRETSRYPEEGSDELQSIYNHLQQDDLSDIKNGGDSQGIEARLAKLTSVLEHFSKSNKPLDASDRQLLAQNASIATAQGNPLSISRPGTPPHRPADSAGDEFPIPSGHETDLVDPVGSLNLGHLSLEDGGKSRYVGTTYWAYISHEVCPVLNRNVVYFVANNAHYRLTNLTNSYETRIARMKWLHPTRLVMIQRLMLQPGPRVLRLQTTIAPR